MLFSEHTMPIVDTKRLEFWPPPPITSPRTANSHLKKEIILEPRNKSQGPLMEAKIGQQIADAIFSPGGNDCAKIGGKLTKPTNTYTPARVWENKYFDWVKNSWIRNTEAWPNNSEMHPPPLD